MNYYILIVLHTCEYASVSHGIIHLIEKCIFKIHQCIMHSYMVVTYLCIN